MRKLAEMVLIAKDMSRELALLELSFNGVIYNPLEYAWKNYEEYLSIAIRDNQKVLFMGMNPGPFGMVQTGVPFGEINTVKDYLRINNDVAKPPVESDKRPISGMDTKRREVSGERFWSMAKAFGSRDDFFSVATVINYCPLAFISASGANVTPVELIKADRDKIHSICDKALERTLNVLDIPVRIGIGKYAEDKLRQFGPALGFLHPSPRNPRSRLFWPEEAELELRRIING